MFNVKQNPPGQFRTINGLNTHIVQSGREWSLRNEPGQEREWSLRNEPGLQAGPTVVLCGGLGSNWFDWDDCARILSASHTVVVFDRPGFGLSEPYPPGEVPTVTGEATRILSVLDALDLPEPAVVVGHSIAGFYVEAFARLYPERAAGMLLLDSSAERDPWIVVPKQWRVAAAHRVAAAASGSGLQSLLGPRARRVLNHSIPPDGIPQETFDWVDRIYRTPSYLDAALVENFVYPDLAAELNAIRRRTEFEKPAIVAAAHTGRPSPWATSWLRTQKRLAQYLDAEFVVVDDAHHHAMIDKPAEVAALIMRLVSHHGGRDT